MTYFWETVDTIAPGLGWPHFGPFHLAVLAVFLLLSLVPSEELAYTEGTVDRQIDIGLTTVTIGSKIFSHIFSFCCHKSRCFDVFIHCRHECRASTTPCLRSSRYASLLFSASRYRPTASCQVGSGVNPASRSFDLSRRELNGRAATLAPYSALVTGTTFVV